MGNSVCWIVCVASEEQGIDFDFEEEYAEEELEEEGETN